MSNVGGVSIPDPGFYSSGNLPWGLDPATNPLPSTTTSSSTATPAIQQEYAALNTADTEELLYASFLSPADSLANGNDVLQQAAALQAQQLAAQQQTTLANANADVTGSSSTTTSSTPASDVSNLPSVASLLSQSDAEAQATLTAFANAPSGSSIIDYQA